MQLERILQSQGFGSRRQCRQLIRNGWVTVNQAEVDNPFTEFEPEGLSFQVDDVATTYHAQAYLVLNKPAHTECSQKPKHHPSVYALLPDYLRARDVQCVGRLDEDTTGLLILTDDGQFNHALISPKRKVDKVYRAALKHAADQSFLQALLDGVDLHDDPEPARAVAASLSDNGLTLSLTLREGRYHQVKRMVAAAGNRVEQLSRVQIGQFHLPTDLAEGCWRWLSEADCAALLAPSGAAP